MGTGEEGKNGGEVGVWGSGEGVGPRVGEWGLRQATPNSPQQQTVRS